MAISWLPLPLFYKHSLRNKLQATECSIDCSIGIYSVVCVLKQSNHDIANFPFILTIWVAPQPRRWTLKNFTPPWISNGTPLICFSEVGGHDNIEMSEIDWWRWNGFLWWLACAVHTIFIIENNQILRNSSRFLPHFVTMASVIVTLV